MGEPLTGPYCAQLQSTHWMWQYRDRSELAVEHRDSAGVRQGRLCHDVLGPTGCRTICRCPDTLIFTEHKSSFQWPREHIHVMGTSEVKLGLTAAASPESIQGTAQRPAPPALLVKPQTGRDALTPFSILSSANKQNLFNL